MAISPKEAFDYVNSDGSHCPKCNDKEIARVHYPRPQYFGVMMQKMQCLECDFEWFDIYYLRAVGWADNYKLKRIEVK